MSIATTQPPGIARPVRLHPKEHGAYAILGMPLVVAFVLGGLNTVAVLTTIATIAGFVANEPLMVLAGRRGERARSTTPSALPILESLLLLTVLAGVAAVWLSSSTVRWTLAACAWFAAAGFAMSAAGWQRSLTAQLTGIIGLTLPSAAVLLAGGFDSGSVERLSAAWIIGRVATTIAVRSVVALQKASTHHKAPRINDVLLAAAVLACVIGSVSAMRECLFIVPLVASALFLRLRPPPIRHMRRIGYALRAANAATSVLMIGWYAGMLAESQHAFPQQREEKNVPCQALTKRYILRILQGKSKRPAPGS